MGRISIFHIRSLLLLTAALCTSPLFAYEDTITLSVDGGNASSPVRLRVQSQGQTSMVPSLAAEDVQVSSGFRGNPELRLRESEYSPDSRTDLLLHFDDSPMREAGPDYGVLAQNLSLNSQVRKMGSGSAMFNQDPKGLVLQARKGSLFAPDTFWGDFTIEFWLYPTTMNEGEQIVAWQGSTWIDGRQTPQTIRVEFRDHRLSWDFVNFFVKFNPGSTDKMVLQSQRITLSNKRDLIPRTWQHHLVRYNSKTGLLEYLINGSPEDLAYTTSTAHQGGEPFRPYVGESSNGQVSIGAEFTGFLDEFRVSQARVQEPQVDMFNQTPGYGIFGPIDFRDIGVGSKILHIDADYTHPGTSDIAFYYKMAMDMTGAVQRDDPSWIVFKPGATISDNNQGRFLYLKVELLPDGSGLQGPGLQALRVTYNPDPPPPAPGALVAEAKDGAIHLSWNAVPVNDLQGYLVYWGTKPKQYFGEGSPEGPSPIDVKNVTEITITGLVNGRLYYFAVASYDGSNNPVYGIHLKRSLSQEVSARPAR